MNVNSLKVHSSIIWIFAFMPSLMVEFVGIVLNEVSGELISQSRGYE